MDTTYLLFLIIWYLIGTSSWILITKFLSFERVVRVKDLAISFIVGVSGLILPLAVLSILIADNIDLHDFWNKKIF